MIVYNNIQFDSQDEVLFYYWLEEALNNKIISNFIYQPNPIVICNNVIKNKEVIVKGKTKLVPFTLLQSLTYNPDFLIEYNIIDNDIMLKTNLFNIEGEHISKYNNAISIHKTLFSYIDIKSKVNNRYMNNVSAVTFPIKQKVLYAIHGIYINKVVNDTWFKLTWLPERLAWKQNTLTPTKTKLGTQIKTLKELAE